MRLDLEKILESKRALRRDLTSRPVAEKLRMLDALRERELAIRRGAGSMECPTLGDGQQDARFQPARSPEKTGWFKK